MMKPKLDDVIEYVKAGQDDPQMEEMLHMHPDGQELLKQARFICRMLRDQSESADDGRLFASFDALVADSRDVADMGSVESAHVRDETRTFYQEAIPRRRAKRSPSLRDMVEGAGQSSEDLGTLELAAEGEKVVLSYEPSEAALRRTHSPEAAKQMDFEGIVMRGRGYTVSVPDTLAGDEPVTIRVTRNTSNLPVKGLELIYMPDAGPFVRVETDSEGRAELPLPALPGTLRFESAIPHLLHIKLKK